MPLTTGLHADGTVVLMTCRHASPLHSKTVFGAGIGARYLVAEAYGRPNRRTDDNEGQETITQMDELNRNCLQTIRTAHSSDATVGSRLRELRKGG